MTIEEIKACISTWDQVRCTNEALSCLTAGNGFLIEKWIFENWKKLSPNRLHCYLGIYNNQLNFFITDDVTDKSGNYKPGENIIQVPIVRNAVNRGLGSFIPAPITTPGSPLDPAEAKTRIVNWILYAQPWFESLTDLSKQIPMVISIPFTDLADGFSENDVAYLSIAFALKYFDEKEYTGYNIELVLASAPQTMSTTSTIVTPVFFDVTVPCPPLCITPYCNLLP